MFSKLKVGGSDRKFQTTVGGAGDVGVPQAVVKSTALREREYFCSVVPCLLSRSAESLFMAHGARAGNFTLTDSVTLFIYLQSPYSQS